MNWTDLNLIPAMPEIVLLTALCAVLLVDLWLKDNSRVITHYLSLFTLVLTAATSMVCLDIRLRSVRLTICIWPTVCLSWAK